MPSGEKQSDQSYTIGDYKLYKSYHGNWVLSRDKEGKAMSVAWSGHDADPDMQFGNSEYVIVLDVVDQGMEAELIYNPDRMGKATLTVMSTDNSKGDSGSWMRMQVPSDVYNKVVELIRQNEMTYG